MTEILSGVAQSLFGNPASYQMPDTADQDWRQHYMPLPHMPLLTSQWASASNSSRAPSMAGLQDVDMAMFQHDNAGSATFLDAYGGGASTAGGPHHYSPPVGYNADASWASDVDMGTPSTGPFPPSMADAYQQHSNSHLQLPPHPSSLHSPRLGSRGALSPSSLGSHNHPHMPGSGHIEERPSLSRSNTAPEHRSGHRRSAPSTGAASTVKRSGSEDGEEDYVPAEEARQGTGAGGAGRGRKRQRVPHTAVERRYRENLNAHLDKLRQTVPAFAKRRTSGGKPGSGDATGSGTLEGAKPSKCEILNGAIEHIVAIDKENGKLKDEVQILRARLEELERWYGGNSAQGGVSYPG